MKITLKHTPEQLELVRAMASKDRNVAYEAQAAVATLLEPTLNEVLNNAPVVSNLYETLRFQPDDNPSLPLDLYHNVTDKDFITVWSQSKAGGLAYNQVFPSHDEAKFQIYELDSAVAFDTRYVKRARVDVISKTMSRIAQEILLKMERTSVNQICQALANASTNSLTHVIRSNVAGSFLAADFIDIGVRAKRINTSWFKGTPEGGTQGGVTDMLMSPEMVASIKRMSYNPVNTRQFVAAGTAADGDSGLAAPEAVRAALWSAAGLTNFMGVNILEFNEFGRGQRYNSIFDELAGSTNYAKLDGTTGAAAFDGAATEIVIAIDRSKPSLYRAVSLDEDASADFTLVPDDQFVARQKKIGYYANVNEGRMIVDDRALLGLIV